MFFIPQDTWEIRTRTFGDKDDKKENRGIFALKDIAAGTIIGDYLGLLVAEKDEEKYETTDEIYLMYYDEDVTVYPDPKKPGIHMINHSCEPNCFMYTYKGHTLFFALRKIHKGEEILVSYQLSPLDDECEPCTHMCFCETPSCTGMWHLSDGKFAIWEKFDDETAKKTAVKLLKAGQQLPKLDSYPESIEDDPVYKLFGDEKMKPKTMDDMTIPSIKDMRKAIRDSGQQLFFPKLGITIRGTEGKEIFAIKSTN